MSFGLHIEQRGMTNGRRSSKSSSSPLIALGIAFVAFCVFDYSPYGYGAIAAFLGDAQRWFQAFVRTFRVSGL